MKRCEILEGKERKKLVEMLSTIDFWFSSYEKPGNGKRWKFELTKCDILETQHTLKGTFPVVNEGEDKCERTSTEYVKKTHWFELGTSQRVSVIKFSIFDFFLYYWNPVRLITSLKSFPFRTLFFNNKKKEQK